MIHKITNHLRAEIKEFPRGFYDSFDYTQTGNNLTHPITLGILSKILWNINEIINVGIDVRFNLGNNVKFQPDTVGFGAENQILIIIDYESPNSSDARIPKKDVDSYLSWQRYSNSNAPYVIITTLPEKESPEWELRYTSKSRTNHLFQGHQKELRKNPYKFWYSFYLKEFKKRKMRNISLININGNKVALKYPKKA